MFLASIGSKDEAGSAGFIVEPDANRNFVRSLGNAMAPETERTTSKTCSGSVSGNAPTLLRPMGPKKSLPIVGVESAEANPTLHRDRMRPFQQWFEFIDRSRETEVCGHGGFHGEQAIDFSAQVEKGAAAVAGLDRNSHLNHIDSIEVAPGRNDALHDTMLEAEWIPHGYDGCTLTQVVGISQGKRREIGGLHFHDCDIHLSVPGDNLGRFISSAI